VLLTTFAALYTYTIGLLQ